MILLSILLTPGLYNAWLFMSVFILQMIVIMFMDKRVRERTHVPDSVRKKGIERYISIVANFVWLLAMVYSVFLPLLFKTIWFYTGFSVFILGVLILAWATVNFITTTVDQVIVNGVYQFSRHPMYLATSLICLGTGIATASSIFILITIIMAVCFHYEARLEERYCLNMYKNLYREYLNRVPMWFGLPK